MFTGGYYSTPDTILSYNAPADEWEEEGGMTVNRRWHDILIVDNEGLEDKIEDIKEIVEDIQKQICPAGWSKFGGNCYKFVKERKVWTDARADCLSQQVKF